MNNCHALQCLLLHFGRTDRANTSDATYAKYYALNLLVMLLFHIFTDTVKHDYNASLAVVTCFYRVLIAYHLHVTVQLTMTTTMYHFVNLVCDIEYSCVASHDVNVVVFVCLDAFLRFTYRDAYFDNLAPQHPLHSNTPHTVICILIVLQLEENVIK